MFIVKVTNRTIAQNYLGIPQLFVKFRIMNKKTMEKYGIKSKGTLWEVLNREHVTEKAG